MEPVSKGEEEFREAFGKAVRAAREAAGLTQRQLAERADVADKYLSRVEVGAALPSVFVASKLARALGLPLDTLTDAAASPEHAEVAAVVQLLRGATAAELDRALRVVRELVR